MNGEKLLEIAKQKGFLDAKMVDKLRAQVAAAGEPVSATRLAMLLVKRNLLTTFQAKSLMDVLNGVAEVAPVRDDDELGLADLEPTRTPPPPAPAKPPVTRSKPPAAPAELLPIDSAAELIPITDDAELMPVDDAPTLLPMDGPFELTPIETDDRPPTGAKGRSSEGRKTPTAARAVENQSHPPNFRSVSPADTDDTPDAAIDDEEISDLEGASSAGGSVRRNRKKGLAALFSPKGKKSDRLGKKVAQGWDSPLMLVGGGALILLVVSAAFLYFFLNRGSGDEMFDIAEEEYRQQSYTQSVVSYQKFLDQYPDHPKVSLARVRQGMAQLRQSVDRNADWPEALATATEQLPKIKSETAFVDARPELGTLLTNIYGGFVARAEKAEQTEEKASLLQQADAAMKLVDNPEYLPSSVRTGQQPKIEDINDRVALIVRDINRDKELMSSIEKIKQATAQQEISLAYEVRRELLAKYPALQNNVQLRDVVRAITGAEQAKVEVRNEIKAAQSDDRPITVTRRVVLADRQSGESASATDLSVIPVLVDGAAYGLNAIDGRLLWRRWLGYEARVPPIATSAEVNADMIVVDSRHHELLKLQALTGTVLWRQAIGSPVSAPTVFQGKLYVSTETGQVWKIDISTGESPIQAQLPQLELAPVAIDEEHQLVLAAGQHSSMYLLDAKTLACREVLYVGHKPDSISVPPAIAGGHIFVIENEGAAAATVHTFRGDANGLGQQPAMPPQRIDGKVMVPMLVFGRRVLITTDRGGIYVFDVDPANTAEPVRILAKTLPSAGDRFVQYVEEENGQVFVAGRQLARYELQASRGELIRKWGGIEGEAFAGPLHLRGDLLVHTRQRKGRDATTIEATRVSLGRPSGKEGETAWTIELGAFPAMEVQFDKQRKSLVALSSAGVLWDVNAQAMSAGLADQVSDRAAGADLPGSMKHATLLGDDRIVLVSQELSTHALLYNAKASDRLQEMVLPIRDSKLSCPPIAIGGSLVLCSESGPVYWIGGADPKNEVLPFQPKLASSTEVHWLRPAVIDATKAPFVAADRNGLVYVLDIQADPKPHLEAVTSRQLNGHLTGEMAVLGPRLFAIQRTGTQEQLLALTLPDLTEEIAVAITGSIVAGPMRLGDRVLVATDQDQLHALDEAGGVVWSAPLPYGPLAGAPLEVAGRMILVSQSGHLWQIASDSGVTLPWVASGATADSLDVGEPLFGQAVVMGPRLFVMGRDCTMYLADVPSAAESEAGQSP